MNATKLYYVIRRGWNGANQSSFGRSARPRNAFESGLDSLVAVVEAENAKDACDKSGVNYYSNQFLRATANPRSEKGLTAELRNFDR